MATSEYRSKPYWRWAYVCTTWAVLLAVRWRACKRLDLGIIYLVWLAVAAVAVCAIKFAIDNPPQRHVDDDASSIEFVEPEDSDA